MSSAAAANKKAEKNQESVRKIALKPENRQCMDCDLKSTPNVVMDFGIFVCSFCSGIHRSHQFKAKGISMTNFKDEEVDFLSVHGNELARKVWRTGCKVPLPKSFDEKGIKEFIKRTYVDKEWYKKNASPAAEPTPAVEPIQKIIPNPAPIEVVRKQSNPPAPTNVAPQTKKPLPNPPAPAQGDMFDFDSVPVVAPVAQPAPAKQAPKDEGFGADFDNAFTGSQPAPAPAPAPKKANFDLDSLFGNSGPAPAAHNPYGAPAPNPYGAAPAPHNPYGAPAPNPYGAPAHNPYGAPAPNPYGAPAPNPYGAPANNPFGAPAPNPYGAPAPNPYGAPAPHNPYGAPAPNPYGAPANNPFGAPAPNPYGAPAPANNPFGAPAPNPYGAAPMPRGGPAPANNPFGAPAPAPAPAPAATPAPAPAPPAKDHFSDIGANLFGGPSTGARAAPAPKTGGFDDAWGGNDSWGAPAQPAKKAAPAPAPASSNNDFPF